MPLPLVNPDADGSYSSSRRQLGGSDDHDHPSEVTEL
jgi:hypothetical protein